MTETRATRLGPTRAEVLHRLRTAGQPVPVSHVSEAVGLHPNSTRFHLDALIEAGLVTREAEQRTQPGRPKVLYEATEPHPADPYEALAQAMVTHFAGAEPDRATKARAAGEAWGDELRSGQPSDAEPLERVVTCMSGLGYEPRLVTGAEPVIELTPCPYIALATKDPAVICQLHLGLVRGLLGPDQPWTVTSIHPWVKPDLCVMQLNRVEPVAAAGA